jgi:hypothetical protein
MNGLDENDVYHVDCQKCGETHFIIGDFIRAHDDGKPHKSIEDLMAFEIHILHVYHELFPAELALAN